MAEIIVAEEKDIVKVTIAGDTQVQHGEGIRERLLEAAGMEKNILLDLSGVDAADLSLIQTLVVAQRQVELEGRTLSAPWSELSEQVSSLVALCLGGAPGDDTSSEIGRLFAS